MDESVQPARKPPIGSVSILYVQALLDRLVHVGLDPAAVFPADLMNTLRQTDQRIPVTRWLTLFELAMDASGDTCLPLNVARHMQIRHLGLLGFTAMSCRHLGDVLDLLVRYERLVDDVNETRVVSAGDHVELHWIALHGPASPVFMQLSLATWTVITRQLTGREDITCQACFSFSAPEDITPYAQLFGQPPRFDQPVTKLVLDKSLLALPITLHNPDARDLLMPKVESALQAIVQPDLLHAVRDHLLRRLASGKTSLTETASALAMAPRTLQYQLRGLGLGYREVLEDLRKELALRHLADEHLSLSEITFMLGYSEQSAFHHAFQRWTGQAPGDYRRCSFLQKQNI